MLKTGDDTPRIISRQCGALVIRRGYVVEKSGDRVTPNEEAALRLVKQCTSVPVPTVHSSRYVGEDGYICMDYVDGERLDLIWPDLEGDDEIKEHIVQQIWQIIHQLRDIPKPAQFAKYYQCGADGSTSDDILIKPLPEHDPTPFTSDADLRQRVYERYLHYHGSRYKKELPDMLPRSDKTVFTHGDIAPRNIIIGYGDECPVIGLIDWESAGWYPDYWEYANIMKPSVDDDWQQWMKRTAPTKWDISGIIASRRVLF